MFEATTFKIGVSLGIPGLILVIFYLLYKKFDWKFPEVPKKWVGPIIIIFLFITGFITFQALALWAPEKEVISDEMNIGFPEGTTFEQALIQVQENRPNLYINLDKDCPDNIKTLKISKGKVYGNNTKDFLENLCLKLIDNNHKYTVKITNNIRYEIICQ